MHYDSGGGGVALGAIYTAYIVDQNTKILHYNNMIEDCLKTPGSILKYEASTPVFGSGAKMSCTVINADNRRL